ncbi:MAG TPA: hypothetical protein VD907_02385 [Verrucomicrobiae bacterium]|nr:hypothetical protein [Verrucomicrobiae bacterium]
MPVVCPCITASTPAEYQQQLERVTPFASRIHVDFMDGSFAPTKSIAPIQAWWPETLKADLHVMFQKPLQHLETLISLQPHLIIVHAEAEGDLVGMLEHIKKLHIKAGVALLQSTAPETARALIEAADHVLIFSGDLGKFGGQADMMLLDKVAAVKAINPIAEIGWDGGVNTATAGAIAQSGVAVLNAGGAIQKAQDPKAAYDALVAAPSSESQAAL